MFSQIKSKIGHYILRKEVLKKNRKTDLVTLSKTKNIGILFDAKNSKSIQSSKSFLKYFLNRNIDVDVLGFVNNRKKDSVHIATIHVNYFNLTDLNILGIPNSNKMESFIKKKHDILINLSLDNSFETKYLALLSNAKYKVGVYDTDNILSYDLMFKLKINSLEYFTKQLIYYLELIDKNNEK